MIPAVRQEKILELLSSNDIVSTDSLMQELNVSVSTLRRDLVKLEEEKKITLLHGGGVRLMQKSVELNIATKLELNRDAKERIASRAASLVEDGDTIFLDPSSTTYLMLPFLAGKNITVVTNGISHINQLINLEIPCILIGGSIKKKTNSCIGPLTEATLKTFYFNKCFLGASGFSIPSGITNHDINERVIKLLALSNSSQPYFLLDHTKYGVITMVQVADLDTYPILTDQLPKELEGYDNFILCD
ncbi:MAG: DeoR/GlpR family DNA-binding transcription regulator [Eisenbergiella sp.]|nr:DeoR/GlpR transcriptional regulator [Bacillota bacterium]